MAAAAEEVADAPGVAAPKAASPRQIVEDLGFGLAQLRVLLLSSGVLFIDGLELQLAASVGHATAKDLRLGVYERSHLVMLAAVGSVIGSVGGGYLGGVVGRRPPILLSFFGMALVSFATSRVGGYSLLLGMRFLLGFSIGVGMSPTTTLQSELTPENKRMVMAMGRGVLFAFGVITASLLLAAHDPTLVHVNWRRCFAICAPLVAILGLMAFFLLPESPVFLASTGNLADAARGFEEMRQLNKHSGPPVKLDIRASPAEVSLSSPTLGTQLRVVFGPRILPCTLAVLFASFVNMLTIVGHGYGEPLVLIEEKSTVPAAWTACIEGVFSAVGAVLLVPCGAMMSRKRFAAVAFVLTSVSMTTLAWSATSKHTHAAWMMLTFFFLSAFCLRIVLKVNVALMQQLSTEIYPAAAAGLGSGMCLGLARVGAIVAPLFFEKAYDITGVSVAFYYFASAISILAACAILACLSDRVTDMLTAAAQPLGELAPLTAKDTRLDA